MTAPLTTADLTAKGADIGVTQVGDMNLAEVVFPDGAVQRVALGNLDKAHQDNLREARGLARCTGSVSADSTTPLPHGYTAIARWVRAGTAVEGGGQPR